MITYKSIVNACKAFADNHHIIRNFGNGELWQISDHNQNSAFEYPLQYMVDVPSSPSPKSWVYAFRVYFVSRVEAPKDRDGNPIYFEYTSEKSAMISCAQDFLSYWVQDVNYKLTIEQSLGVTTFIDAQEDGVTGCYVDIRFVVPFAYDSCIIPMDGVPAPDSLNIEIYVNDILRYTLTPGSELLLNVIDTNGDPVDATISGTNIIVPASAACAPVIMTYNGAAITSTPSGDSKDIFSKDSAGNNVGTKSVDTASELTTVIADHQTELNGTTLTANKAETDKVILIEYANGDPIVITPIINTETEFTGVIPSPIIYIYPAASGYGGSTPYLTGDEIWNQINRPAPAQSKIGIPALLNPTNPRKLLYVNIYNHLHRFVGINGGYYDYDLGTYHLSDGTLSNQATVFGTIAAGTSYLWDTHTRLGYKWNAQANGTWSDKVSEILTLSHNGFNDYFMGDRNKMDILLANMNLGVGLTQTIPFNLGTFKTSTPAFGSETTSHQSIAGNAVTAAQADATTAGAYACRWHV